MVGPSGPCHRFNWQPKVGPFLCSELFNYSKSFTFSVFRFANKVQYRVELGHWMHTDTHSLSSGWMVYWPPDAKLTTTGGGGDGDGGPKYLSMCMCSATVSVICRYSLWDKESFKWISGQQDGFRG